MARTEWLRTFVSVCQTGSISQAARERNLSQPAATAHVRSLEAVAGTPLFVRRRDGVVPTTAGRRLFAEVVDPLERLERLLAGLDAGALPASGAPLRVGAGPEVFAGVVVPALVEQPGRVDAVFAGDDDLHAALGSDDVDVVVTATPLGRRWAVARVVGHQRYALVGAPGGALAPVRSLGALAAALGATPWVAFSADLPATRRFWRRHVGRPFDADVRLVAGDLRVVLSAVEAGLGASLLPTMVCGPALQRGTVVEVFPVGDLVDPRPLWAITRAPVADRPEVAALLDALARASV